MSDSKHAAQERVSFRHPKVHKTELEETGLDLSKVIVGVRRKLWIAFLVSLVCGFIGWAISFSMSDIYQAESILLYRQEAMEKLSRGYALNRLSLESSVELIKLPVHYQKLQSILGVDLDPIQLQGMIEVQPPVKNSNLIRIISSANTENLATDLANSLAKVAVQYSVDIQQTQLQAAREFFQNQIDEIRLKLDRQVDQIIRFKQEHNYFDVDSEEPPILRKLNEVNVKLDEAVVNYNLLYVEFDNLQREYDNLPDRTVRVSFEDNPLKDRLSQTEMALLEARSKYSPNNPKIKVLEEEVRQLRNLIAENSSDTGKSQIFEKNPLKESVRLELLHLQGRLRAAQRLKEDLLKMRDDVAKDLDSLPQEQAILAKLLQKKMSYDTELADLESSQNAIGLMLNVRQGDIELYQLGSGAQQYKRMWVEFLPLIFLMGGFIMGFSGVLLYELSDNKVRTARQVEIQTDIPVSIVIPQVPHIDAKVGSLLFDQLIKNFENFIYRESISHENIKTIAFLSSVQGEGKSILAYHTASYFKKLGNRVCLINFSAKKEDYYSKNLDRKIELSDLLNQSEEELFGDDVHALITGDKSVDDIVSGSCLDWVSSSSGEGVAEILQSRKMRAIMSQLKNNYDLVLIDGPSLVENNYAIEIAMAADATILVVGAGDVGKTFLDTSIQELRKVSIVPAAIVVNKVPIAYINNMKILTMYRAYLKNNKVKDNA